MEQTEYIGHFNAGNAKRIVASQGAGEFLPDFPILKRQDGQDAFLPCVGQNGFRCLVSYFEEGKIDGEGNELPGSRPQPLPQN